MDLAVLAVTEEGGGVLALTVDAEDRGLLGKARAVIGAGGVSQMVLDRLDLDFLQVETQLLQAPLNLLVVTLVAAIAHEDRIEGAIRCVPVALGILPAGFLEDADRRKRNSHHINVGRFDPGLFQTELGRLVGHAVLRVLVAHKALFFGGRDQLAVDIQGGGWIMAEGAGKAENRQCHWLCLF